MKVEMILEDGENRPSFDAKVTGEDPSQKSMAYSVYVLLRMVLDLLNTEYRPDLVSLIGTLHKAYRDGSVDASEVSYGDSNSRTCH